VVSTRTIDEAGEIVEIIPESDVVFDQVRLTFSGDAQNFREVEILGKNSTDFIKEIFINIYGSGAVKGLFISTYGIDFIKEIFINIYGSGAVKGFFFNTRRFQPKVQKEDFRYIKFYFFKSCLKNLNMQKHKITEITRLLLNVDS
jgi:hypothetical protein